MHFIIIIIRIHRKAEINIFTIYLRFTKKVSLYSLYLEQLLEIFASQQPNNLPVAVKRPIRSLFFWY